MIDPAGRLALLLAEGEGQRLEFRQSLSRLDREIVAFANSSGGTVLLGVDDAGEVVGVDTSNRVRSEIQAIARNCDPSVQVEVANLGPACWRWWWPRGYRNRIAARKAST